MWSVEEQPSAGRTSAKPGLPRGGILAEIPAEKPVEFSMHFSELDGLLKECFDGARKELRRLPGIRTDDRLTSVDTLQLVGLNDLPQPNLRGWQAHWNGDLLSPFVCQQMRE